jgi:NADPH2:quinone reductase
VRAVVVEKTGGPEALQVVERPVPEPGPGQVVIDVAASGVNFVDVYQRTGVYPKELPFVVGSEGAGTVTAVGEGVDGVAVGDRVAWGQVDGGGYAETVVLPAERVVPVPDGIELETAAAVMLQGMTAHYLTHSTYPLKRGDTCLVHAAAGGAGGLVVQMASGLGARVFGTVSTAEKAAIAKAHGAEHVIRYTEQDFEAEVKRLTDGRGVDVVYDSVGKTTFDKSLNCLRPRGMMALFGMSSGPVAPLDVQTLNAKGSLFVTRPSLAHHLLTRDELLWRAGDVLNGLRSGGLAVRIDSTYPLARAADAHTALESRRTAGKVLLTIE